MEPWSTLQRHYAAISAPEAPKELERTTLLSTLSTMSKYYDFCLRTIELVQLFGNDDHLALELKAIAQYLVVLCRPMTEYFWQHIKSSGLSQKDILVLRCAVVKQSEQNLVSRFEALSAMNLLQKGKDDLLKHWLAMSLFQPAIAALAWRFQVSCDFESALEEQAVTAWVAAGRFFFPGATTLDLDDYLIDCSAPKWNGWTEARKWEQMVRQASIDENLLEQLTWARWKIKQETVVTHGIALIHGGLPDTVFAATCRNARWLTVGRGLRHFDQCTFCQVLYCHVILAKANEDEPEAAIDARWSPKPPEQCSECDICSQKIRLGKARAQHKP